MRTAAVLLLLSMVPCARADPLVVGDDACPRYAVDVAAFATCDGDRVAALDRGALDSARRPQASLPAAIGERGARADDASAAPRPRRDEMPAGPGPGPAGAANARLHVPPSALARRPCDNGAQARAADCLPATDPQ
jgi:hypothetical protein